MGLSNWAGGLIGYSLSSRYSPYLSTNCRGDINDTCAFVLDSMQNLVNGSAIIFNVEFATIFEKANQLNEDVN